MLDTHLGSGNIAIACHLFDCDLLGVEIDPEYYKKSYRNFKDQIKQGELFNE